MEKGIEEFTAYMIKNNKRESKNLINSKQEFCPFT